MKDYNESGHSADWSFTVHGHDLQELFLNTSTAMIDMQRPIFSNSSSAAEEICIALEGVDRESLLVNWLNELIYIQDTKKVIPTDIRFLDLTENELVATIEAKKFSSIDKVIKAATYHQLIIDKTPSGYETTIVMDV